MKKIIILSVLGLFLLGFFGFNINIIEARSGCCSWHGGVQASGCGCNDGTALSATCAPYYSCNSYSSGSSSSYDYSSYYPTIPTCPLNSYYDGISSCTCNYGYIYSGNSCISYNQSCQKQYGLNSYGDKDYCYCSVGYQMNSSKTSCVLTPIKTETQSCQETYGLNSYSSAVGKCSCNVGYEWAIDNKSCVRSAPLVVNTEPAPTCSLSFTPKTITLGETTTLLLKTTGVVNKISEKGTGFFAFLNQTYVDDGNIYIFKALNSGKSFSEEIKPDKIGETSRTYTITGSGGLSNCTASLTIIPKPTLKDSSKTISLEQTKIDEKIAPVVEQKGDTTSQINLEPAKKVKWYQKLFKWFIGK